MIKSWLRAEPATKTAGIGFQASILVWDEHAEHEYARENYLHSKPTIDSSNGQCISCFTENAWDKDNLATELFEGGLDGKNGWKAIFFPYSIIKGRDEKWYDDIKINIPESELRGLTPELYMLKNYPRSIEEALSVPQTVSAFDKMVLKSMMEEANKQPRIHIDKDLDYNYINIYRDFHLGEVYVAASDVSLGVGRDYQATVIMNARTGVIVADILSNTINEELFAMLTMELLEVYGNPKWWIEFNLYGRRVVEIAQANQYRNLGYRDAKREKAGFVTDEKTRADIFASLIPAINNNQITVFNSKGVEQLGTMIRNADKNGRIEARSGGHDDYPIALGICWLQKKTVTLAPIDNEGIDSLHFVEASDPQNEIMERVLELKAEREHWEKESVSH